MLLVYVICKDKKEAQKIAKNLLEKKLIACANMWKIDSMYEWQGKLVSDKEYALLLKTKEDNYQAIEQEVISQHSYSVPAIFAWQINQANKKYLNWLNNQC